MSEVRIVDPNTGGEKGQKPERYDLIPWQAMDEVARVYAFGAKKYTKLRLYTYEELCLYLLEQSAKTVTSILLADSQGNVVAATRRHSGGAILSLLKDSVKTRALGTHETKTAWTQTAPSIAPRFSQSRHIWLASRKENEKANSVESTESVFLISNRFGEIKEVSAQSVSEVLMTSPEFTLTMITIQDGSEVSYVVAATTVSECLRTARSFLIAHGGMSDDASSRELSETWRDEDGGISETRSGSDNWLRGYSWRLSLGALFRHVARFACREDFDQESGLHHLAHAVFHCLCLIMFGLRRLGTDDRMAAPTAHAEPRVVFVDTPPLEYQDEVASYAPAVLH